MNIKQSTYDQLTPAQRTAALLDAIKRDDRAEGIRLMKGIERKSYVLPDAEVTDRLMSQILADTEIQDKAAAFKTFQLLLDRKVSVNSDQNVQITFVHKRHATWPPEDAASHHVVSDEFMTT